MYVVLPSKTLGAFGDGGALFSSDEKLAARIRSIANHGMKVRYYYERIGVNSRLDSIQAAILDVKLKYLDKYISARQKAADWYDQHLSGIEEINLPQRVSFSNHTFHQYTIRVEKRDQLQQYLKENGVPSMIYYPEAIHLQVAYQYLGCHQGDFPVAENHAGEVLSLPMHTELDENQVSFIAEKIRDFFSRNPTGIDNK
jgi:UDP-2-acetamido-2-deoxy-ribo-hexuluronate aminotransferase